MCPSRSRPQKERAISDDRIIEFAKEAYGRLGVRRTGRAISPASSLFNPPINNPQLKDQLAIADKQVKALTRLF
jgi:hypothetical protein